MLWFFSVNYVINSGIKARAPDCTGLQYKDVIMSAAASQITSVSIDYLLNCLFRYISKKTAKLRVTGVVRGIHRWPVDYPHKGPVTRKRFPFDDTIMMQHDTMAMQHYNAVCPRPSKSATIPGPKTHTLFTSEGPNGTKAVQLVTFPDSLKNPKILRNLLSEILR